MTAAERQYLVDLSYCYKKQWLNYEKDVEENKNNPDKEYLDLLKKKSMEYFLLYDSTKKIIKDLCSDF